MKKLLGISLVAVLSVTPLMANAAVTDAVPTHADNAVLAKDGSNNTINPGYALATANDQTDGNAASAGYVKGAYNAAIKAINTVDNKYANSATKEGVAATVDKATATGSANLSVTTEVTGTASGSFTGAEVTGSASGSFDDATVSGTAAGSFTDAEVTGSATGSFNNAAVTGALTSGAVTGGVVTMTTWGDETSTGIGSAPLTAATALSNTALSGTASGSVTSTVTGTAAGSFTGATVTGTASGSVTSTITATAAGSFTGAEVTGSGSGSATGTINSTVQSDGYYENAADASAETFTGIPAQD